MKKEKLNSNQEKNVSGGYIYYNEKAEPRVCNCIHSRF